MDIHAIDHIEFYVEDAEETARRLCDAFGFRVCGEGSPHTGLADCRSLLLRQRDMTLLVTSALSESHPAAGYVKRHGDGVAVIAVVVDDAQEAFHEATGNGAVPVSPPAAMGTESVPVIFASVAGFGDVAHRFVSRGVAGGPFAPRGYRQDTARVDGGLLKTVDHIAVCVPAGELTVTVRRYQNVFGFAETFEERILVGSQAMDSKVVQNASRTVTLTLLEPDTTREPGQIDQFIGSHGGAGVQHLAFLADDITVAVREISTRGMRFLHTPASYYDVLTDRIGELDVPVDTLRELSILADRDRWGLLLQIFTESQHPRGTLFYELIERRGARTFGSNNIKALYEALERQQADDQSMHA